MFRASRSLLRPNGRSLLKGTALQTRIAPSIAQRASFATKKDDRADPPPPEQPIDHEAERKIGERLIEAHPDKVSLKSSTTNSIHTPKENIVDPPILENELKHDVGVIKDTFDMSKVPRESKILGLAGTLPYLATSLSTIYLGWDLKQQWPTNNFLLDHIIIDHDTARYLLSIVEPIQLGYGAVIISFLGAIHWGLEYAEKSPLRARTRFRYGMGLISPIVAWPTLIMPVPYALTTQFMAFVGLYFADAQASTKGWTPHWYAKYRFMLTAMVGLALFVSLVGRQKIDSGSPLTNEALKNRLEKADIAADQETDWDELEKVEIEKRKKEKKEKEEREKKEAEEQAKKEAEEKKKNKGKGKGKKKDEKKKSDDAAKKGDDKDDEDESKDDKEDSKDEKSDDSKDEDKEDSSDDKADDKKDGGDKEDGDKEDGDKEDDSDDKDEGDDSEKNTTDKKNEDNKGNEKKTPRPRTRVKRARSPAPPLATRKRRRRRPRRSGPRTRALCRGV